MKDCTNLCMTANPMNICGSQKAVGTLFVEKQNAKILILLFPSCNVSWEADCFMKKDVLGEKGFE